MRILIVESNRDSIVAARTMLKEHELTVVNNYTQAHEVLATIDLQTISRKIHTILPPRWNAQILENQGYLKINLFNAEGNLVSFCDHPHELKEAIRKIEAFYIPPFDMVLTSFMLPLGGYHIRDNNRIELPYGPIIAIRAIQARVKKVGIIHLSNSHEDPFSFAFDDLNGFATGDVKIITTTSHTYLKNGKTGKISFRLPDPKEPKKYKKFHKKIKSGKFPRVKNWRWLFNQLMDPHEAKANH